MTIPNTFEEMIPSWLQLQAKLGKFKQDLTAFDTSLNDHERNLRDIAKGLAAIEERLKRLEASQAPSDPYEAEIANAIAAKDPQRLQDAVFASASPQARPSARAMEAARQLVHYCFAHSGSVDAIARIIDDVYSGKP